MSLPRLNRKTAGFWVAQFTDFSGPNGVNYDYTLATSSDLPINWAAQYTWQGLDSDGIPQFKTVAGTVGPINNMVMFRGGGNNGGVPAQWGTIITAEIYDVGPPIIAGAIASVSSGVANFDQRLRGLQVVMFDGSTPTLNQLGLVLNGTDLSGASLPIFVPTGAVTGSMFPAQITLNMGAGLYTFVEVDSTLTPVVSGRTGTALELNHSHAISDAGDAYVFVTQSGGTYLFFYPLTACTSP